METDWSILNCEGGMSLVVEERVCLKADCHAETLRALVEGWLIWVLCYYVSKITIAGKVTKLNTLLLHWLPDYSTSHTDKLGFFVSDSIAGQCRRSLFATTWKISFLSPLLTEDCWPTLQLSCSCAAKDEYTHGSSQKL